MMILRTGACLIRTADAFVTAHGLITEQLELYRFTVLMCRNLEGTELLQWQTRSIKQKEPQRLRT